MVRCQLGSCDRKKDSRSLFLFSTRQPHIWRTPTYIKARAIRQSDTTNSAQTIGNPSPTFKFKIEMQTSTIPSAPPLPFYLSSPSFPSAPAPPHLPSQPQRPEAFVPSPPPTPPFAPALPPFAQIPPVLLTPAPQRKRPMENDQCTDAPQARRPRTN